MSVVESVEPLANQVILEFDPLPELCIQQRFPDLTRTAVVAAVGPGRRNARGVRLPPCVTVGERVVVHSCIGIEVSVDDQELRVCKDDEIMAVLDEPA